MKQDKQREAFAFTVKYMRALLDAQPALIGVVDMREGDFIDGNQVFLRNFGYPDTREMFDQFRSPQGEQNQWVCCSMMGDRETWVPTLLKNQSTQCRVYLEVDGKLRTYGVSAKGMLYASGVSDEDYESHNYVIVTFSDITMLMEEIRESREKDRLLAIQTKYAAMGEMVGNIAHQWRQPLNALGLVLQKFRRLHQKEKLTGQTLEEGVEKGMELIRRMSETIDDFRNFARPDREARLFPVEPVLRENIRLFREGMEQAGIAVELAAEGGETLRIRGQAGEFSQVFLNLLMNAKDVIQEKGILSGSIRVALAKKGAHLLLSVEDNGGGVPEEVIDRIFDPYFTTKEEGKGSGVGLYMSRKIVEESLGGRISVENGEEGARFFVVIPLAAEREAFAVPSQAIQWKKA